MKRKLFILAAVICMIVTLAASPASVNAAAYGTRFTTSVTYQNVGTAAATISFSFYDGSGNKTDIAREALPKLAGTSVFIGSLASITPGFSGSAILYSDQPVVATMVQLPPSGSDVKNRPLANGFSSGAANVTIATVLKNMYSTTTQFSVQNVDSVAADVSVKLYPKGSSSFIEITVPNLAPYAAKYFDMGTLSNVTAASFDGSAKISAKKAGTSTDGAVVAAAMELSTTGTAASAFEGTTGGAGTVYMPSAFCKYGGAVTSSYAVQNVGTGTANVTVTYSNGKTHGPIQILAGNKYSFSGCDAAAGNPAGFIGSATISSTGSDIIAMGKITGNGLSTAFLGASTGARTIAVPYVRWTNSQWDAGTRQRVNIAIQNVGGALAAGSVNVVYFDKDGNKVGTDTLGAIAPGAKLSSNATKIGAAGAEFGYAGGSFGGAVIVQGPVGSQLVVVARVETKVGSGSVGEDYNGIPITDITLP